MIVITSHINLDFDGFASMIAAKKLYPEAQLVLPNVISKDVRNFLALYKESFDLKKFNEIKINKISKLIIVDTSSVNRVADFKEAINNENVSIIVFDHHTGEKNKINAQSIEIEKLGACTTILLKKIIEKKIKIRPFEATILMLGIYADTNCLTFSSTTIEDIKAVAYLFECGAYLDVVSIFIGQPLSSIQNSAFDIMLKNVIDYKIKGLEIGIIIVKFEEYIDELSYLIQKILSIKGYDTIFGIISIGNRIYIMGRSIVSKININQIVGEFGGAGHSKAGSAIVKGTTPDKIKEILIDILDKYIEPSITARDILSFPVKTVSPDTSLNEVDQIMLRYGHTGIPVVGMGKVLGIATRKDVEKAIHHGYGHAPIKAYMSRKVVWAELNTTLKELQHKMVDYNVGRLPIIENGQLIGIVTRTDIVRQTFGDDSPSWHKKIYIQDKEVKTNNFSKELNNLNKDTQNIIKSIGEICDELNYEVYIVGGFVRDLILGIDNLDLDVVIVGDAVKVAEKLCHKYNGEIIVHSKFGTATVNLLNKYKLDIVTARCEFYEYPAALPTVEEGSIKSDLYRRDFTINSMAICINKNSFGRLIDYFGGQKDLQEGLIRVLYNLSFIEDPTRIFRAVRFEQRYDFKIEEQTYDYLIQAINSNILDHVSSERLSDELMISLNEEYVFKVLSRMHNIGLFEKVYSVLEVDEDIIKNIKVITSGKKDIQIDFRLVYLLILCDNLKVNECETALSRFQLNKYYKNTICYYINNKNIIIKKLSDNKVSSLEIYNILKKAPKEVLYILKVIEGKTVSKNIRKYENSLKDIRVSVDGKTLKSMGIKPGPKYTQILNKVLESKINGTIITHEDEIKFIQELIH